MAALKRTPATRRMAPPHASPTVAPGRVPIARPRLPTRAAIAPYLDRIDAARWYANYGPLVGELELDWGEARRTRPRSSPSPTARSP